MNKPLLLVVFLFSLFSVYAGNREQEPIHSDIVLVTPGKVNISSDFYPLDMIAESLKLKQDSLSQLLNGMVINHLKEKSPRFFSLSDKENSNAIIRNIRTKIEIHKQSDDRYKADLSNVPDIDFQGLLAQYGANYLVVISGYFIHPTTKPFQSVFHSISFSVFDAQKKLVFEGIQRFNTYNLDSFAELQEAHRKSSKRTVQEILKTAILPTTNRTMAEI
jgi:hypothetical protein